MTATCPECQQTVELDRGAFGGWVFILHYRPNESRWCRGSRQPARR